MKKDDARIDELLAGGTLGGPHYDAILRRVLERTQSSATVPAKRRSWRWVLVPSAVLVPALGAWLLLIRPTVVQPPVSKGVAGAAGALTIGCGSTGSYVCHPGETLMFSVNAATSPGYVGAYAERLGDPTPERIWYFPDSAGTAPFVAPGVGTVVLGEGIRIGTEHAPGRYRVTVWIADQPVTRASVDLLGETPPRSLARFEIEVMP